MTQTAKALTPSRWAAFAVPVLVALTGLSATSLNTDKTIELGFASALADRHGSAITADVTGAVAGSEDFWLRQPSGNGDGDVAATDVERVVWRGPVAAGGTFVIGSGTDRKEFEVLAIEPHEVSPTRIDMTATACNSLRVQARDGAKLGAPAIWFEMLTHSETPVAGADTTAAVLTSDRAL